MRVGRSRPKHCVISPSDNRNPAPGLRQMAKTSTPTNQRPCKLPCCRADIICTNLSVRGGRVRVSSFSVSSSISTRAHLFPSRSQSKNSVQSSSLRTRSSTMEMQTQIALFHRYLLIIFQPCLKYVDFHVTPSAIVVVSFPCMFCGCILLPLKYR